jgi:restriction system protein
MTVWLVRAGRDGLRERAALDQGAVFIGFDEVGDVSAFDTKPALFEAMLRATDHGENTVANHTNQVWSFAKRIEVGDIVALPLKRSPEVALGVVEGPYEYDASADPETRHRRRVRWVRPDTPRSAIGQDLLYSLGAFLTVCSIQRNDAD